MAKYYINKKDKLITDFDINFDRNLTLISHNDRSIGVYETKYFEVIHGKLDTLKELFPEYEFEIITKE